MTDFTREQLEQLTAPLDGSKVSTRNQSGRDLSYIEGWWAIHEANRIFGFGRWSSEVRDLYPVVTAVQGQPNYTGNNGREGYLVAYRATVRVTVGDQIHEDTGSGSGIDYTSVAAADESASKEAVTDARKRALMQWGNPFGLALYDKSQAEVDYSNGSAPARNGGSAPRRATADGSSGKRSLSNARMCPEHKQPWAQNKSGRFAHPIKDANGDLTGWCNEDEFTARETGAPAGADITDPSELPWDEPPARKDAPH